MQSAEGALQGACAAATCGPAAAAIAKSAKIVRTMMLMVGRHASALEGARCRHCSRAHFAVLFDSRSKLLLKCTPGDLSVTNPALAYVRPHTLYKVTTNRARCA